MAMRREITKLQPAFVVIMSQGRTKIVIALASFCKKNERVPANADFGPKNRSDANFLTSLLVPNGTINIILIG